MNKALVFSKIYVMILIVKCEQNNDNLMTQ